MVYFIDGDINGVFTAVYEAYVLKEDVEAVTAETGFQPTFDTVLKHVESDIEKAERIEKAVIKYGGTATLRDIKLALLSCDEFRFTAIFNYIKLLFTEKRAIYGMFSEPFVITLTDLKQKVLNEAHRIKGFLRFAETEKGVFYAHYSPDNDITELIAPHFIRRYKNMPFIIHDVKRDKLFLYGSGETRVINYNEPLFINRSEAENNFDKLWKQYFKSVNIDSRQHKKQQDNYLPRRYRKHMNEFED